MDIAFETKHFYCDLNNLNMGEKKLFTLDQYYSLYKIYNTKLLI